MDTKEKILLTSLDLFSKDGYEAVSVSMISGSLGIAKSALYKHYKSKRDIFDCILARMNALESARTKQYGLPEVGAEGQGSDEGKRCDATVDNVIEYCRDRFRYWTEDSFAAPFRKMITLEQYRSPEMGELCRRYLTSGPLWYIADVFAALGYRDAQRLATEFYSPMYLLYSVFDGARDIGNYVGKYAVYSLLDSHFKKMRDIIS